MSPLPDLNSADLERAQLRLQDRAESMREAADSAASQHVEQITEDGEIRVVVDGRMRIVQLDLGMYAVRSPNLAQQVVAVVNAAIDAAQVAYREALRSRLDAQSAGLLDAAEEMVRSMRGPEPDDDPAYNGNRPQPGRAW